jgi:hypothetical protein
MERQGLLVLHLENSKGYGTTSTYHHSIGCLCGKKWYERYRYYHRVLRVNGVSAIFGVALWINKQQCNGINP